ncbi:MAG: asparaginase [Pyrinomonadaceae bacterium]
MQSEILVKVIRGGTVESIHRGHFVVIDGGRNVVASAGDPETVTFLRSAAKPLQAIPLITSGAADAFEFSEDEIAMASASHSGEASHVRLAKLMLERIGLSESHLRCGVHLPFNDKESERMQRAGEYPTQLHNNCSGKHIGMLALAKHIGADLATYEEIDHPVQRAILHAVSVFTETPVEEVLIGIDGCAAPNFAVSILGMAKSFLNLVSPPSGFDEEQRDAAIRITQAMLNCPDVIGGTERLDTILIKAAPGKLISKVGADGVWLCGVLPSERWPSGLGIALKVEDGDDMRARPVVVVELLRQLGILSETDLPEISPMPIKNRRGDTVGKVDPLVDLHL